MSYEILTFHAELGGSPANSAAKGPTGPQMIDLMFRSARRHDPAVTLTIVTTPETDLVDVQVPYTRLDTEIAFDELMLERSRSQLRYLTERDWSRPLAMLDSDILVNSAISEIFDADFDVGLTWRERPTPPINGGALFLNNKRPDRVVQFFSTFVERFESRHKASARWYGDQTALYETIGSPTDFATDPDPYVVDDVRFQFFPCETHNYTPHKIDILKDQSRYLILHFKGERKWIMRAFWLLRVRWGTRR